jgi:hypothetical protein
MNYQSDPLPGILSTIASLTQRLHELESLVHSLLSSQADRISELESHSDPYSQSGQAICNYYDGMDEDD